MSKEQLKIILKDNKLTKGIRLSDNGLGHISHLLNYFGIDKTNFDIAIQFYVMGYATGKLE